MGAVLRPGTPESRGDSEDWSMCVVRSAVRGGAWMSGKDVEGERGVRVDFHVSGETAGWTVTALLKQLEDG